MAQLTNTTDPTTSQAFIILISPNFWSNRQIWPWSTKQIFTKRMHWL